MANKRYDEFPAGAYDTSKIFLQADPITGALEKINLPVIPAAGIERISGQAGSFPNAAGGNTDIFSFSLPANTLSNVGDALEIIYTYQSSNSNAKTSNLIIGGITVANPSNNATAAYTVYVTLFYLGANVVQANWYSRRDFAIANSSFQNVATVNWAIANTILVRLSAVTASEITGRTFSCNFLPA